jgi:DNA polymerase IIIc chi subunit
MKLFMFYVGGNCGNSNIELHDVRFSIGETAEHCHEDLRRQWWGDPESLHLDCWGAIEQADGFDIELTKEAQRNDANRLFFVNLGGYDATEFTELHRNVLMVVPDATAAKAKAKAGIRHWATPHKDRLFEVEKAVDLSASMRRYGYSLKLTKAVREQPFEFVCKYLPIA